MRISKLFLFCSIFMALSSDNSEVRKYSLPQNSTVRITDCMQNISGLILDKETKKPIPNALVSLFLDEKEITIVKTNSLGEYAFKLACDLNYKIAIKSTNYASNNHSFKTGITAKSLTQNFELNKQCYQVISGVFRNGISKEIIPNVTITLNKNGEEIEKVKVINGTYSFNIECDENYSLITSSINYINDFYAFSTTNKNNDTVKHDFYLESECIQTITGTIKNKITKEPISATLKLFINNIETQSIKINNDGKYIVQFPCATNYKIVASRIDCLEDSYNFLTDYIENKQPDYFHIKKDLFLEPNECFQIVSGTVLDKITNKIIPKTLVTLIYQNQEIKSFQTNEDATYLFNIKCGLNYEIKAEKADMTSLTTNYSASSVKNEKVVKNVYLEQKPCKQLLNIVVHDKTTKLPIANTSVSILENNNEIAKKTTDAQGKFSFDITCEKAYKIVTSNKVYSSETVEFNTSKERDLSTNKTLELTPLECKQIVTGLVLDKITKLPIANTSVSILENNSEIAKKTTDVQGQFSFDITCEKAYKIVTSNKVYSSETVEFETSNERNSTTNKTLELQPLECKQIVTGLVLDKITKLPIANTSVSILENNSEIAKKTTDVQGKFSFDITCEKAYKIVASNKEYTSEVVEFNTSKERDAITNKTFELEPSECNQTVTGIIRDKITKKPLPNTTINLYKDNELINSFTVGDDGVYEFPLKCETSYKITVFKNNSLDAFRLKTAIENGRTLTLNIDIEPLICVQYINGVLKESISENAIPNATITLFNYNKEIAKTETDSNGSFYFEIECSKAYTISAQKDNYTTVNTQLFSSEKTAVSNSVSLTLEPLIPFTEKKGIKYIETKPLNFILDEFEINNDVKLELNKVVYNMNQNPNVKIEINYHTDSRGPDTYNLQLTKNRANSTKDYLISKGINSNRIEANGYGETKLLNNCSNNVKCSEEEHSVNRRTEFKVISN